MLSVYARIKGYFFLVAMISVVSEFSCYGAAQAQQPTSTIKLPGLCGYEIPCCGCTWYCCKCCAVCKAALALRSMSPAGQRVLAKRPSVALKGIAQSTGKFGLIVCARDIARAQTGITAEAAVNAQELEMQKIDAILAANSRPSVTKTEPSLSNTSGGALQSSPPSAPSMMRDSVSTNSQ